MKLNALPKLESPFVALELPGLCEHADVIFLLVVELDERFNDMLPIAVNRAGAVIIRMNGVGNAAMKDRDAVSGSGEAFAQEQRPGGRAGD